MKLLKKNQTYFVYILSFFLGVSIYFISLVSVVKLLGQLSLTFYPALLFSQGFLILLISKFLNTTVKKSVNVFYQAPLSLGLVTITLSLFSSKANYIELILTSVIFFFSMISVMWIEVGMANVFTTKTSILLRPNISIDLSLFHELGVIFGGILSKSLPLFLLSSKQKVFIYAIPIILCQVLYYFLYKEDKATTLAARTTSQHFDIKQIFKDFPFIIPLMVLLFVIITAKNMHGFAQMLGMKLLAENANSSVSAIFSKLSILQSGLIVFFLISTRVIGEKTTTWIKNINIFIIAQAILLAIITIFVHPLLLIGTGAIRKLLNKGLLNNAITILFATIPSTHRMALTTFIQVNTNALAFVFTSLFAYLHLSLNISLHFIFGIATIGVAIGFFASKKLLNELNTFQVKYITKFHKAKVSVADAVNACLALSNKNAGKHFAALSILLWWKPRPVLTKAIIYSLGKMKVKENIKTLMDCYIKFDSENIQKETILALNEFKTKEVYQFTLNAFSEIIENDKNDFNFRDDLLTSIINSNVEETYYYTINQLKSRTLDNSKLPVLLRTLGNFKKTKFSDSLAPLVNQFLDYNYPFQTKIEAAKILFSFKKYRLLVYNFINKNMLIKNYNDKKSLSFLIADLNLPQYLNFVKENNDNSPEYIIRLIQLGDYSYNPIFLSFIFDEQGQGTFGAIKTLKIFHNIKNKFSRFSFYLFVITDYPDRMEKFLELLALTDKDFDEDRASIYKEIESRGIHLVDDFQLFKKSQKSSK